MLILSGNRLGKEEKHFHSRQGEFASALTWSDSKWMCLPTQCTAALWVFQFVALCLSSSPDLWCDYQNCTQVPCSALSLLQLSLEEYLLFCGMPWVLSTQGAKWRRAAGHPCRQKAVPTVPLTRFLRHQPTSSVCNHTGNKVEWKLRGWSRGWGPPEWGVIYSSWQKEQSVVAGAGWTQWLLTFTLCKTGLSACDGHVQYWAIIRPAPSYWKI